MNLVQHVLNSCCVSGEMGCVSGQVDTTTQECLTDNWKVCMQHCYIKYRMHLLTASLAQLHAGGS